MSRLLLFFCAALAWGGTAVGQQWPTVWHANTVWQDNPNLENQDAAASVADSAEFNTVGSTSNMLVGAIGWDVNSPAFDNIGQNAPYWIWGSNAAANQLNAPGVAKGQTVWGIWADDSYDSHLYTNHWHNFSGDPRTDWSGYAHKTAFSVSYYQVDVNYPDGPPDFHTFMDIYINTWGHDYGVSLNSEFVEDQDPDAWGWMAGPELIPLQGVEWHGGDPGDRYADSVDPESLDQDVNWSSRTHTVDLTYMRQQDALVGKTRRYIVNAGVTVHNYGDRTFYAVMGFIPVAPWEQASAAPSPSMKAVPAPIPAVTGPAPVYAAVGGYSIMGVALLGVGLVLAPRWQARRR